MTSISERQVSVVAEQSEFVDPTLIESFGNRKIQDRDLMIMGIINSIESINIFQKRDIYFYHLWQEDRKTAFKKIKNLVGEVREDELDRVLVRINRDNVLVEKYSEFHAKYLRITEPERIPKFIRLLKKGTLLEDAMEDAEISKENGLVIFIQSVIAENQNSSAEDIDQIYLRYQIEFMGVDVKEKIVQELNKGISLEDTMKKLGIVIDTNDKGNTNKEIFADFCNKVERIEHPEISDYEIAKALHTTAGRVSNARKRLRQEGRAVERAAKQVSAAHVRQFIPLKQKVFEMTVSGQPSTKIRAETGLSYHQLKYQRDKLVAEKKLPRKMTKRIAKKLLSQYLYEFREEFGEKAKINLSALYREKFKGKRISPSSINAYYHELVKDHDIPLLIASPKRKPKSL